jgi:hypothetical protein
MAPPPDAGGSRGRHELESSSIVLHLAGMVKGEAIADARVGLACSWYLGGFCTAKTSTYKYAHPLL